MTPGTHSTEEAVNKQLNDKERVAAALENPNLVDMVNKVILCHPDNVSLCLCLSFQGGSASLPPEGGVRLGEGVFSCTQIDMHNLILEAYSTCESPP